MYGTGKGRVLDDTICLKQFVIAWPERISGVQCSVYQSVVAQLGKNDWSVNKQLHGPKELLVFNVQYISWLELS